MACRSNAIAGPLRLQRFARALATRAVKAARLVALATVVFFQLALAQEQRDPPAMTRQPSPPPVPGHLQSRIDRLAADAKQAFHARMEPGIPKLILTNILDARRDLFSILRDHVRSNFNAAIDALVAEATTDERVRAVEHALRIFVEAGQTTATDALFAEMIERAGADPRALSAALRYSVGLAELPAALAMLTEAPFVAPFAPPGDKALPAYRHAASLDPDDTWTWIVVALKSTDPGAMDSALVKATRSAEAQGDWGGRAFVLQVFGLALELRGRPADGDQYYAGAVQIARDRSTAAPSDPEAARELARNLLWLGSVKTRRTGEIAQARMALEEALGLRQAAALRHPDGMRETIDLISCHLQLNMLFHQNGFAAEAKDHLDTAMRLYGAMADRSQFTPTHEIDSGLITEMMVIAGALTLVAGFVLLALYRRRMRALMRAAAKAPLSLQPEPSSAIEFPGADAQAIALRFESAAPSASLRRSGPPARAAIAMRSASWVHALSGVVFAAIAHPHVPPGRCRLQLHTMRDLPARLGLADRARAASLVGAGPPAPRHAARRLCRPAGGRLPHRRAWGYTAARGSRHPRRRSRAARFHDLRHVRRGSRRRRGQHAGRHEDRRRHTGAARLLFALDSRPARRRRRHGAAGAVWLDRRRSHSAGL